MAKICLSPSPESRSAWMSAGVVAFGVPGDLAGPRRPMLVVLDNAGSAEQVRPLLPGSPSCVVVVTSCDALTGLVARDGATRVELDLLPLDDAVGLLRACSADGSTPIPMRPRS